MTAANEVKRPPATLEQQAAMIRALADGCCFADGSTAPATWVKISAVEAEDLRALAERLGRMAPHEKEIRRAVVGR